MTEVRPGDAAFLERVRQVSDETVAATADDVDGAARFPTEAFERLRADGALSAVVPGTFGGAGVSFPSIARACCSSITAMACKVKNQPRV